LIQWDSNGREKAGPANIYRLIGVVHDFPAWTLQVNTGL
jgi:hypothetical protein